MPTKEEILNKQTYKDQGLDMGRRVFYTLIGEENDPHREKTQAHRNSKAIAVLLTTLHQDGALTDEQIDNILWDVIH
jgi:hypothetical protein